MMLKHLNTMMKKTTFGVLMLSALLVMAACSNDVEEMELSPKSNEPTEKELLLSKVQELANEYGVLVAVNEERWQKKLPSIVEIRDFIIDSKEMMENRDSVDTFLAYSLRMSRAESYSPVRFKTMGEFHPSVSGSFSFWGFTGPYGCFVDMTVNWTDGGSEGPNSVYLNGYINGYRYNFYYIDILLENKPCSPVSFYSTHHSFMAYYNYYIFPNDTTTHVAFCVQYNGETGTAVLYFDSYSISTL